MCGILLQYHESLALEDSFVEYGEEEISCIPSSTESLYDSLIPRICARGPNYASAITYRNKRFFSSVLSLRAPFTKQPLQAPNFVVQFNGELYNPEIDGNDGQFILDQLADEVDILEVIHKLDGEFALCIYDKAKDVIYFGRDPVGKRSLVYRVNGDGITISSLQPITEEREEFIDCTSGVVYTYDFGAKTLDMCPNTTIYKINDKIDDDFQHSSIRLQQLDQALKKSVSQRTSTIHPLHVKTLRDPLFSILFSGGLDCTIITALAASLSKPNTTIDLLNVGFNNPRTGLQAEEAPDRKLALESWRSLQILFPETNFNLVEINVSYDQYLDNKKKVIDLMYPKVTEMDLSIAIAFYFASKGFGIRNSLINGKVEKSSSYQSNAKVLLSGLGADELFGGYHKFANKDLMTLVPELDKQINNISERNLMRDDKVVSSNGVEIRYPFLSNEVIDFSTNKIEINYKVSKRILRDYAKFIGLGFVSQEPKRAIQFGAKSAKMTANGNKKGTDRAV